jgi:hypothetical protein
MLSWLIRILFVLAAPIAALLVPRDALNFSLIQTLVAITVLAALIGLAAVCTRGPRTPS